VSLTHNCRTNFT